MGTIESFNCALCSKNFETSRGLKLHVSRYCLKPNDKKKIQTAQDLHLKNSHTNHYVSSCIKSAFSHTKNADFEIKSKQKSKKEKLRLPYLKNRQEWKNIEDDVEIALKRAMPKYTWKSRDKFENIIYDIVKKHCFVEPPNSEQKKPKIEYKDVVLERLK